MLVFIIGVLLVACGLVYTGWCVLRDRFNLSEPGAVWWGVSIGFLMVAAGVGIAYGG